MSKFKYFKLFTKTESTFNLKDHTTRVSMSTCQLCIIHFY